MTQKKDKIIEDLTPEIGGGQEGSEIQGEAPQPLKDVAVEIDFLEAADAPKAEDPPTESPKRSHKKRGPYEKRDPYKPQARQKPIPPPEIPEDPMLAVYRTAGGKAVAGLVQLGASLNPSLMPQGEIELAAMSTWMMASGNLFVKHRWRGEVSPEVAFVTGMLGFYGALMTAERNRPLLARARDLAKDAVAKLVKKFRK